MFYYHRYVIIVAVLLFVSSSVFSQDMQNAVPDTTNLMGDSLNMHHKLTDFVDAYGSYRIGFGCNNHGQTGMSDNASRFGIFGVLPVSETIGLQMFAQVELGLNLVDRDKVLVIRSDPGYQLGEADNTLYSRLGVIGLELKQFSISFGKQWSAYYDVAAFTDRFFAFGGEASGAFNLGGDGGISGTGRANRLILLRAQRGSWKLALQAQTRFLSEENIGFADTWGGSLRYLPDKGLQFGVSFNIVRDGLDRPAFNQPKKGDMAFLGSVAWVAPKFHMAVLAGRYIQHERMVINDSTFLFYDAYGVELFASVNPGNSGKWRLATGFNYLQPDKKMGVDEYRLLYFLLEASYGFAYQSYIFSSIKLDLNRDLKGQTSRMDIFAIGFRFSFGY